MEIKKAISFAAQQNMGTGKKDAIQVGTIYYPVKDERLANMEIPIGEEPVEYIESCERALKLMDAGIIPLASESEETKMVADLEQKKRRIIHIVKPQRSKSNLCNFDISNFVVTPICKKIFVDAEGNQHQEKETFEVEVAINGMPKEKIEIKTSEIGNIVKIVKRKFSFANVNYDEKDADKIIEAEFRENTKGVEVKCILFQPGWQKIRGTWRYVVDGRNFGNNVVIATGKRILRNGLVDKTVSAQNFLELLNITKDRDENYVMVLFSLLGILYKPLEMAGIAPRFTLFINGKSGAMKSSLGKVLFTQLSSDEHRNTMRRIDSDTLVSFERAIVESGRDTTLLFDDYAPAKTTQQKNEMKMKLESIVRMVGDGATKSRSNGKLADLKGKGVHGVVAVTGELKGTGLSSNLRCLYVEMKKGSVNTTILSYFQRNPDTYTTFLMYFVDYIEVNWETVLSKISSQIDTFRAKISEQISEPRYVDSVLVLLIAADIICDFLHICCNISKETVETEWLNMRNGIFNIAIQNEKMAEIENYSELFINTMATLMNTKEIVLKESKLVEGDLVSYDGFTDENYFYFLPDRVYAKCTKHIQQIGQYLPFDMKEMSIELYQDGFIKKFSNGKNHKTYFCRLKISNSMKINFWKIRKDIFIKTVDSE